MPLERGIRVLRRRRRRLLNASLDISVRYTGITGCHRNPLIIVPPPAPLPLAAPPPPASVETLYRTRSTTWRGTRPKEDLAAPGTRYRFAASRHLGQTRVSGEPYMIPSRAGDPPARRHEHGHWLCLQTGLLHDVGRRYLRDPFEEIRKEFGGEVARCVDGVTKLSKLDLASREETPGRKRPQDAAGHGRRYSRHPGQAR